MEDTASCLADAFAVSEESPLGLPTLNEQPAADALATPRSVSSTDTPGAAAYFGVFDGGS